MATRQQKENLKDTSWIMLQWIDENGNEITN